MTPFLDLPRALVEAVEHRARADADLLCDVLTAVGYRTGPPCRPAENKRAVELAVEAAAALRLEAWEAAGLTIHLEVGLPSAAVALQQVIDPAIQRARQDDLGARLAPRVLETWLANFAWSAPKELGIEVLLGGPDALTDDETARIADFLWSHGRAEDQHEGDGDGGT